MILNKDVYFNAEVWALLLHGVSLALLLVLFARWLPWKYRHRSFSADMAESKGFVLADLLCGGTFLLLLLLSAALILFPSNSFSIHTVTEREAGQIDGMERRAFLWSPSYSLNHTEYTGTYLHIGGKEYYCAVSEELQVGDSIELLHAEGSDYVIRYKILEDVQGETSAVSASAGERAAQGMLIGTGLYLFSRLCYFLVLHFKKRGKNL